MDYNFQPEKDDNPPSQYLSPLSIPSPQGFRSLINGLELVPTAQGRQPTEVVVTGGDQQPQSEKHIVLNELELVPTAQGRQPTGALVTGGDRQPQSEEHIVLNELELVPTAQGRQPTGAFVTGGDQQPQSEEHIVPTAQGRQPTEVLVTGGDQQPQSEEHMVVISEQLIQDTEASEDSLFSEPMHYSGWLSFLEEFILGPNQRDQIWRLRLLSGISLYIAAVVGFLFYLGDLPNTRAQAPYHYQMVMLITSVGAPIVVAVFSLFVSFWFACVPNRRSSWITGLSVANFIMLCGPMAIFWAHEREAGN